MVAVSDSDIAACPAGPRILTLIRMAKLCKRFGKESVTKVRISDIQYLSITRFLDVNCTNLLQFLKNSMYEGTRVGDKSR